MNKNKDIFDTIDEYFSQINNEELTKKINKSVHHFSKTISETFEDSLKNSGYNNFNEFIDGEIKDQKAKKPTFNRMLKKYSSRREYINEAIHQVNYGIKYRGYYQDGHIQALKDIEPLLDEYAYDLDVLAQQIKKQSKEIKDKYRDYKKAYITGYIDGLEYVYKAIQKSKEIMMERILHEIK